VNAIQRRSAVALEKSRDEGFGLAVMEAMWKRRPVVSTRVGGLQEQVVDGETGFLIDPCDSQRAGQMILTLLDEPELADREFQLGGGSSGDTPRQSLRGRTALLSPRACALKAGRRNRPWSRLAGLARSLAGGRR